MADHKYVIPPEYQDQLRYVEAKDERSNEQILDSLSSYAPVTSEKNIWAFWDSGVEAMPKWCQNNVCDWVRIHGSEWSVRVLDAVSGSPNEATKYISPDLLPPAFVRGKMDGPYVGPHSADLLRGACLTLHGGVFMDVGIILCRHLDRICWSQLEDPQSPFQVSIPWMYGTIIANHFVAARKGDPFIQRWHELFLHLWRDRTNHEGLIQDPLVAFGSQQSFDDSRASDFHWDFKVPAVTVFEYITQVVAWQRLCMLDDAGDNFSCADYWAEHVLVFDVLPENWAAEQTLGFQGVGQKMLDIFSSPVDGDKDSETYKEAQNLVWRLLTRSSMQKITHGKHLTHDTTLGTLWDEQEGKDSQPGTFAELLRYGTVHFQQTRESIKYAEAVAVPEDKRLKKGVLEP